MKPARLVRRVGLTSSMGLIAGIAVIAAPADQAVTVTVSSPIALTGSSLMAPQPPELSEDEKRAIADKEAGRPFDERAYKSARQKQIQAEKYKDQRNKSKQRRGGR